MKAKPRLKRPLYWKIFLVLMGTSIALLWILLGTFRSAFEPGSGRHPWKNYLEHYVTLAVQDIGIPPNLERARHLSKKFGIAIRIQGPQTEWATQPGIPIPKHLRPKRHIHYLPARFIAYTRGPWTFVFGPKKDLFSILRTPFFIRMIVLILVAMIGCYLALRILLRPLSTLLDGVEAIRQGQLNFRLPVGHSSDFSSLAKTFNSMADQVQEMIARRDRLLLDVSHEFRSPLTRLKMAQELLESSGPSESLYHSIREDLNELEAMVSEILETERFSNLSKQALETVNPLPILQECCQIEHVPLDSLSTLDSTLIQTDPRSFRRALLNLIRNAKSHGDTQTTRVSVSLEPQEIKIDIEDLGAGIPQEEQNRIFEAFYRTDPARDRKSGGFGLGLSLSRAVVEHSGGSLSVQSPIKEGKGTRFTIRMPYARKVTL